MTFWHRCATLTLGHSKYSLDGLDFSFEVPFEDSDETPVATIKVTNLSAKTRASIKKNTSVVLNAGYEGDVGSILIGKVVGLKHKQDKTDWTTTITVQPCADEILGSRINKTYVEKTKASAIVRDLLNIFGVEVSRCELSRDVVYPRGRVCKGNLKEVLAKIVVDECKSRFIVRATGQIYITKAEDGIKNGVTLTPANGLLRSDEEKEVIPVETEANKEKKGEDREDEDTISRSCLLNYRIATAEVIKIQSSDLNGQFTVVSGTHIGDRSSDWTTEMELAPYSKSSSGSGSGSTKAATATVRAAVTKPVLRFGSRGKAVGELQTALNRVGPRVEVDGLFGPETRAAVAEYQQRLNLPPDGVAKAQVWDALIREVK